ncbi:hypothetical protein ACYATO_06735 [Lactobacillaceae bacterium Melli_B3]
MGSKSNQINSSASDVLSATASQALVDFNQIDSQYGEAARQSFVGIVQSVGADIEQTDAAQSDIIQSLTSKSATLISSAAKQVVSDYADTAISNAVTSAHARAEELAANAKSSAAVAISYFTGSAYEGASNYATPSEAASGVSAFNAALNNAIDNANVSSANAVVNQAVDSLNDKLARLGSTAADAAHSMVSSTAKSIIDTIQTHPNDVVGANSVADSGVAELDSMVNSATLDYATEAIETVHQRFKHDLNQVNDSVANDTLSALKDVIVPAYKHIKADLSDSRSVIETVNNAIDMMNNVFTRYGSQLVSAGLKEYTSSAYHNVAYLSGNQLSNANSMIASAASAANSEALNVDTAASDAVNQYYGLIPLASDSIKQVANQINTDYVMGKVNAARAAADSLSGRLASANKTVLNAQINESIDRFKTQIGSMIEQPTLLNESAESLASQITSMASAAITTDPYASAWGSIDSASSSADIRLNGLGDDAHANAASAVNLTTRLASQDIEKYREDDAQLNQIGNGISHKIDQVIDSYITSDAYAKLATASLTANAMIDQISDGAVQMNAASQFTQLYDDLKSTINSADDLPSATDSGVAALNSMATSLIAVDPTVSAHYAVQSALSSAAAKTIYLDSISYDNADSEMAGIASQASSAMNDDIGNANALSQDVDRAAGAADEIVNRYNQNSAQSEMGRLASSATYEMRHISNAEVADQASSALVTIQHSLTATLNRAADRLSTVSLAMSSAYSSVDSITARYISNDVAATAYSNVDKIQRSASVATQEFNTQNQANVSSEVAKQVELATQHLATTHDHNAVVNQLAQTVGSILNRYTLTNAKQTLSAAATSATSHLSSLNLTGTADVIQSVAQSATSNVNKDAKDADLVQLDLNNGLAAIDQAVQSQIDNHYPASAAQYLNQVANQRLADRSAAGFDVANFSSAVNKSVRTNQGILTHIDDSNAIHEITSLADSEVNSYFAQNVVASATNALSIAGDEIKNQLAALSLPVDSTIEAIIDKYTTLVNQDAAQPEFAHLDQVNGITELHRYLEETISEHPKPTALYQIKQQVAKTDSLAAQYFTDLTAMDRDLYRTTSSASSQIEALTDDVTITSVATSTNATVASIGNAHIASAAKAQIDSAAESAHAQVVNIANVGQAIDVRNAIDEAAKTGNSLVAKDQSLPRVVRTDTRNAVRSMDSLAQAAISDDVYASANATVDTLLSSAVDHLSAVGGQPMVVFDSAVDGLLAKVHADLGDVSQAELADQKIDTFNTSLTQLLDQHVTDVVENQITDAADAAKFKLSHLHDHEQVFNAQMQIDAIVANHLPFPNEDLHQEWLLKTDVNNVLIQIDQFVTDQLNNDSFAQAALTVQSAFASANAIADQLAGSVAANMHSEVASANSSYAEQFSPSNADAAPSIASHAVDTFATIQKGYIEATNIESIQKAATRMLNEARAYSAVDLSQLEAKFETIVTKATKMIQADHHDLALARLDATNAIDQLHVALVKTVDENEADHYLYMINCFKQSATAKAGSMNSHAAANMSSALNRAALAADNQPSMASAQMDQIVNDYYADLAKNQVSTAANHAHRSVLQLSNVTKVSTSAAINSVVSSADLKIGADHDQPSYAQLDASDGIKAIDSLLDSAIAKDSTATLNRVAASATSSAHDRMGSLTDQQSLMVANEIQQLVDRAASVAQAPDQLVTEINSVANQYLSDSIHARINTVVDEVRHALDNSNEQYEINAEIQKIVNEAQSKINHDIENPAYLSLDVTTAIDALRSLINEYQNDEVTSLQQTIADSASAVSSEIAGQFTSLARSNISSAAASVARSTNAAIISHRDDDEALNSLTSVAASQFEQMKHNFVAESAMATMQTAIDSAESYAQIIRNVDGLVRIHEQLHGVADSFKQLIDHDAHNASLAALDADNATLEIKRIASQAVDDDHLASATVTVQSVADDNFSNADLMNHSQSDNYTSAIAQVMRPLTNGQLNSIDDQVIDETVTSVKAAITSVANDYYGQWAHSAVSQAASDLLDTTDNYTDAVRMSATSFANRYQDEFTSHFAMDSQSADLIVLDAQNAASAINSAASSAAENDSIAFANSAISNQISSANSVLTELNGHTDSTADMQMDSVANQANEKLGSVYSNLNAVMMVINSASEAMNQIANSVITSSAHSAVTSAADSLMLKAGRLTSDANQANLISSIKQAAESVNRQIDTNANYPVSVSMATASGIDSLADSTTAELKQTPDASTAIALETIAASAASNVGALDSFADANFSSAVSSINARTSAYLADRMDDPQKIKNEIGYVSKAVNHLMQQTVSQSANEFIEHRTQSIKNNLNTIADVNHRKETTSEIEQLMASASAMITSDAFDHQLASLDATNAVVKIQHLASAAFNADDQARQSMANREALQSAKHKVGSLASLASIEFDSQIAALNSNQMAEYPIGLDSIANAFIQSSANTVVVNAQNSAVGRTDAIRDANTKNNLLQMVSDQVNRASMAISSDAANSMFASLDADNATSAIAAMVNDAIERDPVASASVSIERAMASVTASMSSLNTEQQIRFDKHVAAIINSADDSLVGPFADKNNVINDATHQMISLANEYTLNSAYGAIEALASSASIETKALSANDSLNVKTFIDNALSSANSQISAHSASSSLIADAVNDAANTVARLASSAVMNSPVAAAKASLASMASSAATIADSLTGRNSANFSSAIASAARQAATQFTSDDETRNQQALQTASTTMRNVANFHAAQGALTQISQAADTATTHVERLADDSQRSQATEMINQTVDEYRVRIQNDTDNLSLINLDVQNAQRELALLASEATKHDDVASALIELDHHASSYADQTTTFDSLQGANLSSAVNSVTSQAAAQMQTVASDPAEINHLVQSAQSQMSSLFNDYVFNSANNNLSAAVSNIEHRFAGINDAQFNQGITDRLNLIRSSAAETIQQDAYCQSFVQLDLMNASAAMDDVATSAVNVNPLASVAYQVQNFVSVANSRAAHLTGSSSANFSSAVKSVARQANQAIGGVSDAHALDTITVATNNEINSTVSSYLVQSAYTHLQSVNDSASAAMQFVNDQAKVDATKALNSTANSAAQMVASDANDDQLISLDVKDGETAIASLTSAAIADQPIASAFSVVTSTASAAVQKVGSLTSFASANMSSALNRFAKEAYTQLTANGADQQAIDQIQSNTVASIDDVANSYVASSASQLITNATDSAYAVINQFDNAQAATTASNAIDDTLTTVANQFADDRSDATLMSLDADNAVAAIHSAAQFITTTDEVASGNIYLSNAANSAYSATAGFGNNLQLNKQIRDVLSDTNTQFANGANVHLVVTTAIADMDEIVHNYFIKTTDQRIAKMFMNADRQLNSLLDKHGYESARNQLIDFRDGAKATIQKDAHDGKLIKLDLINIERQFEALIPELIKDNEHAVVLNQIAQRASAAVQNEFQDVADDNYLNFSSAVNSVVRSFEATGDENGIQTNVPEGAGSFAIASIDSLAQSYVVSQAMASVTAAVDQLRCQTKDLSNFVTQSSASSAINQIANDAADHILSDNADFGAISLDTDNAISAASAVVDSAVANDSIADGKRSLSSIYASAASFAQTLDSDDAVSFSLAVSSQSNGTSLGADVDNRTTAANAASGVQSLIDSYVASSANESISQMATTAISRIQDIKDATKRDNFAGILTNVITDAMAEINRDNADQTLVDIDVQNNLNTINSLTDSMVRSDPGAAGQHLITSAASSAMANLPVGTAFDQANFSSAINSVANQASLSVSLVSKNLMLVNRAAKSSSDKMDRLATDYRESLAQAQISSAYSSAYHVATKVSDEVVRSSAVSAIDSASEYYESLIDNDAYNSDYVALDLQNGLTEFNAAVSSVAQIDANLKTSLALTSVATQAASRLTPLGDSVSANFASATSNLASQTNGMVAYAASDANLVSAATSSTTANFTSLADSYVATSAHNAVNAFIESAQQSLALIADPQVQAEIKQNITALQTAAKATITQDAYDDRLISLDVRNVERKIGSLMDWSINDNIYASANAHVRSVADSLTAVNSIADRIESDRLRLALERIIDKANHDITGAGMNNDLINATVTSTAAQLNRVATRFAVNDAHSQVASLSTSVTDKLDWFVKQSNEFVTSDIASLATSIDSRIDQYADDKPARQLMIHQGQSTLRSYVDGMIDSSPQAFASSAVSSHAMVTTSIANQFNGSNQANFNSEVMTVKQSADAAIQQIVNDPQTAENLASSVAEQFSQIARKYVAHAGYSELNQAASSADHALNQFGMLDDQTQDKLGTVVREFNSMIDSDAGEYATVRLDYQNASLAMSSFVAETAVNDSVAYLKWQVQSQANAITESMGSLDDSRFAANFSSAMNSAVTSANAMIDSTLDDDSLAVDYQNIQANLTSITEQFINRSASDKVQSAHGKVQQLMNRFGLADSLDDQLKSIVDEYTQRIKQDVTNSGFASLDANNADIAMRDLALTTIHENESAAVDYQLTTAADAFSATASTFASDDQVRFSSAVSSIVEHGTNRSLADAQQVSSAMADAESQMHALANQFIGHTAMNQIDMTASMVNKRIAALHDDVANAVIRSAANSANSAVIADSANPMATSLAAHDGIAAMHSLADSLIADQPVASANDHLNQLVNMMTNDVLMSDSLADMNFLSAVAKQSKRATDSIKTADDVSAIASITDQASTTLTSIAHSYVVDSASQVIDSTAQSAMALIDTVQNNVARSQAINWVHNEASAAINVIEKDVNSDSLVSLDIDNARASIKSVADNAANSDANVAFSSLIADAKDDADSQAATLTGSLAANYSSAVDSTIASIKDAHQSLSTFTNSLANTTMDSLGHVAASYVAKSADQRINAALVSVNARHLLDSSAYDQLSFMHLQAQQTINSDAHDVRLVNLDVVNTLAKVDSLVNQAIYSNSTASFNHQLASQASSASVKIGSMNDHSAANFSSAATRIINDANHQLNDFGNANTAISSAAMMMNELANQYVLSSANASLSSIVDSANVRTVAVNNYASVENTVSSAAAAMKDTIERDQNDPALVSLAISDMQSQADYIVTNAVHGDPTTSALAVIDQVASSLMSDADLSGHAEQSYASVQSSVAQSAYVELINHQDTVQTITTAKQTLTQAARHFVSQSANLIVDKALDVANNQAVEINDIHSRNQTISAIGQLVNNARELIKAHVYNPFFAYLDAQNAAAEIAQITSRAVQADAVARTELATSNAARAIITSLRPLIDKNEAIRLNNRLLNIVDNTSRMIGTVADDDEAIASYASSASAEFTSIARSYVADSANAVVTSAADSATIQVEGINDTWNRNTTMTGIDILTDSAAALIDHDAGNVAYASLDADNASLAIGSVTDSAIANDPTASANAMISSQIQSAANNVVGMAATEQSAFSAAVMSVAGSANIAFANADDDADQINSVTSQTVDQLHSVAREYVVTSAKAVISTAASDAHQMLDTMFTNSEANVYSSVANIINMAVSAVDSDSSNFATVSLDAYNASSAIDQLVKTNENSYAHSLINSHASAATSTAGVLNDSLRPVAVNSISRHASAAHSSVNLHFGHAEATLSDVNSATSAMADIIGKYVQQDPVASAHSVVASAAESANSKAANLNDSYRAEMGTDISSAAAQANTLIAMNPANSLLDSQLASDAASSMNSYVNMYEATAANEATTSYAASAYAQIDKMDDKFKRLANQAVAFEVDNAKQAFAYNSDDPDTIFTNVSSAAENMKFLVANYTAQNSSAVADAKQSFAADMDSVTGGVYSQARVLSINNRGQINSLTGSVATSASANVSEATTVSSVAATYHYASSLIGSVADVAVNFARQTASAELTAANEDADQSLSTMDESAKQSVVASINTLIAGIRARIDAADNTVNIVNEVNSCVTRIKRMVASALSANLRNTKDSYKTQILSAATAAYHGVNGLAADAQSLTNAAISMAASDANANIDQTDQLAEIQMLTSAGIASINEASSVAVSNVKTSGNSLIASAANAATGRTTTLSPVDKSAANSVIASLANVANAELNSATNVSDASAAITSGTSAINSAVDSTIASVISSAMAMANNLAAQNERDSVRLELKSAADAAYASTASLTPETASAVNEYVSQTASTVDQRIMNANNDEEVNDIASSAMAAFKQATNSATGIYTHSLHSSAVAAIDAAASSAATTTDAFNENARASLNQSIAQVTNQIKTELQGVSDVNRADNLVQVTIDRLNQLVQRGDVAQLDVNRDDAKRQIQTIADQFVGRLNSVSTTAKQTVTNSIHEEADRLMKQIDTAENAMAIKSILDGANSRFEQQIDTANSHALDLSRRAAMQVLTSNADAGLAKLTDVQEVISDSARETINELNTDAFGRIDSAQTVDQITEITNDISKNINHVVKEALSMNEKM